MSNGPDYDEAFRRQMSENFDRVIPALERNEIWLQKKITNAAKRYNITEEEIRQALRECHVLRFYFAKDPSKQSMHEKKAAEFIKSIPSIEQFKKVPARSKCISEGRVISGRELKRLRLDNKIISYTKGIDFEWHFGGKQFYAYHKHTELGGGAQDNQSNDMQNFVRESVKNDLPNCIFLALCDGAFYTNRDGKMGESKMDVMKGMAETAQHRNVFAMTTADLPDFLEGLANEPPPM